MLERLVGKGKTTTLSMDERRAVFATLKEAGISIAQYGGANFFWAEGLRDTSVQALYRWQDPDTICLRPFERLAVNVPANMEEGYVHDAIRLLIPSIVHELVHRRQFRELGKFRYWAYSIPGLYYSMLDAEAFALERMAAISLNLVQGDYEEFGDGSRK